MKPALSIAALAALSLSFAPPVSAHHIWIEIDAQGTRIYFGEFGENLREASPGSLDKLAPQARAVSASGRVDGNDSVVAEDIRWPSFERKRDGKRGEEAYDFASHVTSLTVVQPAGIEPLPAAVPAKPH